MLFAIANNAEGSCVMFDFNNGSTPLDYSIQNSYDSSGLFKGFLVCNNNDTNASYRIASTQGTGGYSVIRVEDGMSIKIYRSAADLGEHEFHPTGSMKNVSIGRIDINGYNATYFIREENRGSEQVDRETREPLLEQINQPDNVEDAIDAWKKVVNNNYREVNIYSWVAELYMPIDSKTVLTDHIIVGNPEEAINTFKQIYITRVTGENPRYLINEGNRLFKQGLYEEALSTYDKIKPYGKYKLRGYGYRYIEYRTNEVMDNIGLALYELNRTNETLEWFDLNKPRSSKTWNLYGQLLESKNYIDESEYAYDRANNA